jgi:hypothetical protein
LFLPHKQAFFGAAAVDAARYHSASIRLTTSRATGEIAGAFFPRRALAATSASPKKCLVRVPNTAPP